MKVECKTVYELAPTDYATTSGATPEMIKDWLDKLPMNASITTGRSQFGEMNCLTAYWEEER